MIRRKIMDSIGRGCADCKPGKRGFLDEVLCDTCREIFGMLIETRKMPPEVARVNEAFVGIYIAKLEDNPAKHDAYQEALDAASVARESLSLDDVSDAIDKLERASKVQG